MIHEGERGGVSELTRRSWETFQILSQRSCSLFSQSCLSPQLCARNPSIDLPLRCTKDFQIADCGSTQRATRGCGGEHLIGVGREWKGIICLMSNKMIANSFPDFHSATLKGASRSPGMLVQGQIAGRRTRSLDNTPNRHWFDGSMCPQKHICAFCCTNLIPDAFQSGKWKGTIESSTQCNLTEVSRVSLPSLFPLTFSSVMVLAWKYIFLGLMYRKIR